MFLDLRELKRSGKNSKEFFFEYSPETELSELPNSEMALPVRVCGEISLIGEHSASVYGEINFKLSGLCTRCATPTEKEFVFSFDEVCGEDDVYPVVNDRIDLSKIVDDTIIMNMPLTFLCKDDCKGLCYGCGVNLNEQECKCK